MTMVSTREVPWMKLGKLVDSPMTAKEAAEAGGLNFDVIKADITVRTPNGGVMPFSGRKAIIRGDNYLPLGIMSTDYPLLQYRDAFDFMDTVDTKYVAAGALKGGKQGFMVVKMPEIATSQTLNKFDPHEFYAVLRTSHDGSRAIEVSVMPLRQRCMNQLTLRSFTNNVPYRWSIKHTTNMMQKLDEAKASIANLATYVTAYEENVEILASIDVNDKQAVDLLENVLPDRPRRSEQITRIIDSWHTTQTVGFDYTGWGLLNSVSEYFDWGRAGGSPESRFVGALQGQTFKAINGVAERLLTGTL